MSNKTQSTATSGGIGFGGLLAAIFITLKLCHVIAWSWWWVLSPIWIPLGIALLLCGICLLIAGAVEILK